MTQSNLILEYYKKNPKRNIKHHEIVDWATDKWLKRTGKKFRDPDRAIRKLHQMGLLQKINTGVYRYDPDSIQIRNDLEDFLQQIKTQILKRDGYKCVLCDNGKKEGFILHVDHIKPKDKGGKATFDNGQTLCSECNILKKRYGTIDFFGKYSKKMLKIAQKNNDKNIINFLEDILLVIKKHGKLKVKKH